MPSSLNQAFLVSDCPITKTQEAVKGILGLFALPIPSCPVVKYALKGGYNMTKDSSHSTGQGKRGWWSRFLDKLAKANKEALQKGCKG
jgi:hypothetical protein